MATVLTLPRPLPLPGPDRLDPSWGLGLVMAAHDGLHHGGDIVWTYGPLGRLETLVLWFRPEWVQSLATTVFVDAAFTGAVAALLVVRRSSLIAWLLVTAVVVSPTVVLPALSFGTYGSSIEYELVFTGIVLLLLMFTMRRRSAVVTTAALAGTAFGTVILVKQSEVLVVIATLVIVALIAWRGPTVRLGAGVTAGATLVVASALWFLSGQRLEDIVPYVQGTYAMVSDYRQAIGLGGADGVGWALGSVASLLAIGVFAWRGRRFGALRAAVLLLPLLATSLLEGFIRNDSGHNLVYWSVFTIAMAVLSVEAFAGLPLLRPNLGQLPIPIASGTLTLAAVGGLLSLGSATPPLSTVADRLSNWPHALSDVISSSTAAADAARLRSHVSAEFGLSPDVAAIIHSSSVDVLPWDIELAWAYGLRWDPRPVLQSYQAYDPYLDGRDAAHLLSTNKPAYLLYGTASIDGRYAPFDEPLTLQALLRGYFVSRSGGITSDPQEDFLLLHARASPSDLPRQSEGTACAPLGQPIAVPQLPGRVVFANVDMPYSLRGTFLKTVFRAPYPTVQFTLADGLTSSVFRFVQAQGGSGLLVNAYLGDNQQLMALLRGNISDPVAAITFDSPGRSDYAPRACATYWSVPLPVSAVP